MGEGGVAAATGEAASGAAKKIAGAFMSPGIDILKAWQGIVEIILRGVVIVLSFIVLIAGSVNQNDIEPARPLGLTLVNVPAASAAAGWILFVSILMMIYEILFVVQRFLNINLINSHFFYVVIVDAIVHGAVAAAIFAGAAATASYVPRWKELTGGELNNFIGDIVRSSEALVVFAFFLIIPLVGLAVFMLLGALIFKWNTTLAKYATSSSGESTEPE